MSVTMTKGEGMTVLTVTSDPKSSWPPLCQVLGALCYSPACCSVSQGERRIQGSSQSALGVVQIIVGFVNVGLGAILLSSGGGSWRQMDESLFPVWLGVLFIAIGFACIVAEKFPSPCLVTVNVLMNLAGVAFAITAIVLYTMNLVNIGLWWLCTEDDYYDSWKRRHDETSATPSTEETMQERYWEKCMEVKELLSMLLSSVNIVLIVVAVLQLCVNISSAVLGIKVLTNGKAVNEASLQSIQEPELFKPLLEEVTTNPVA